MVEATPTPLDTITNAFDNDRFEAIEEFAFKAASFWRSIQEAAYRGDRATIETHCRQVQILTRAAYVTVRALGTGSDGQQAEAA